MSRTTRQIIDGVLEDIAFTNPVELADVVEVHRRIRAELAKYHTLLPRLEVYHRIRDVRVEVREVIDGREAITYQRTLEVT